MRAVTVLVHTGALLGFVLGAIMLAPKIAHSEGTDWNGPFVQFQKSIVSGGSNDLSFTNDTYGIDIPIYEMGLDGKRIKSVAVGLRNELGESGVYVGVKGAVHFGAFTGSEEWSAHDGDIGAGVNFRSKTLYTLGVELGAELSAKILGYLGAGIAAADMTLCGQAHVLEHSVSECESGFAPGWYGSAGALVDLERGGWTLGGEVQFLSFEGEQEIEVGKYDLGNLEMDVDEFLIKVTLEKRF